LIPAKAISLATENDRTWAKNLIHYLALPVIRHCSSPNMSRPFPANNICSWRIYPRPRTPALSSRIGRRRAALESANCDRCRSRATYRERQPPIARGSIYTLRPSCTPPPPPIDPSRRSALVGRWLENASLLEDAEEHHLVERVVGE
jgi:hypothetical protein